MSFPFGIFILFILFVLFIKYLSQYMHHKKVKWILVGYIVILLLSVLFNYQLKNNILLDLKTVTQKDLANINHLERNFYEAARKGNLDKTAGVYINGQWSFKSNSNQLKIVNSRDYSPFIIAKRKDTNDGKIEVINYISKSFFDGIDITKNIKPLKVSLEGNNLYLKSDPYRLEYIRFKDDFTVAQFRGDEKNNGGIDSSGFFDQQIIYLRVPKNLQIDNGEFGVEFVGEAVK